MVDARELSNLIWTMHDYWLHYRHTMDQEMLRERLFPVLRGAVTYVLRQLAPGPDGRLHIPEAVSPEYPKMAPDEQERVRQQMTAWAQLSPAERQAAREQYKTLKTLPPEKKQEVRQKWEQYQSLPPEKKRELATKPPPGPAPPSPRIPVSSRAWAWCSTGCPTRSYT